MPTFGSLFAGIGGIDLGLERAGWTCRWQVESDPFCQIVLGGHWPLVTRYGDVRDVDWSKVEPVDMIAGGFPCQPVSSAGHQRGTDDDRWLWPEFARAIRDLRPRIVFVENVPGLLAGHGGMDAVMADLAASGFDAEWDSVPAAAVGAPHERYRVWIVARARWAADAVPARSIGTRNLADPDGPGSPHRGEGDAGSGFDGPGSGPGRAPDAAGRRGREMADPERVDLGHEPGRVATAPRPVAAAPSERERLRADAGSGRGGSHVADPGGERRFLPAGWVYPAVEVAGRRGPSRSDRSRQPWATEPDVGRMADGIPYRVDRLRALGNAVVPQVAEVIGRHLLDIGL